MAKSSQRQFLARVDGIPGSWMTMDGGNINAPSNKMRDGGNAVPDILTGPPEVDDITVTRVYDPDIDDDLMRQLRGRVGSYSTTLSKTPLDSNLVATRPPIVYPNAKLTGFQEPPHDANGSDGAVWGLIFSVPQVR